MSDQKFCHKKSEGAPLLQIDNELRDTLDFQADNPLAVDQKGGRGGSADLVKFLRICSHGNECPFFRDVAGSGRIQSLTRGRLCRRGATSVP
jgi:hypothetical protein